MATKTIFKCKECNATYSKWKARCTGCDEYSSIEESVVEVFESNEPRPGVKTAASLSLTAAQPLSKVDRTVERLKTEIGELDRVLGGGFVSSEVVLIGGEPGAGKSTLALMLAQAFTKKNCKVLYISGEESTDQIALRADRMKIVDENILLVHTSSLNDAIGHIETIRPDLLIFDSLQSVASSNLTGSAGSIQQSREAATILTKISKELRMRAFLVSQVNKDGEFNGAEAIQHVVDASLFLDGDKDSPLKFLRATKNRFGTTNEVGIFQHEDSGLVEVLDPSGVLSYDPNESLASGAAFGIISEGVRQIPIEIQGLVTRSTLSSPRRQFNGIQFNRGQIICAILDKFCRANLSEYDVFGSTMFGVKLNDPQADLALASAILSSINDVTLKQKTVFVGELSLTGEARGVYQMDSKVKEAERMGFERIVMPNGARKTLKNKDYSIEIEYVRSVTDLKKILDKG